MNRRQEYFHYLCDAIGITQDRESYMSLAEELFQKEFYFYTSEDSNIYEWALYLRFPHFQDLVAPCSIFEVIIALATQWEHRYGYDYERGDQTSKWFFEILNNSGLSKFTNENWGYNSPIIVDDIVTKILDRQYDKNGNGGFFPLTIELRNVDLRDLGLLDQLGVYISEKFNLQVQQE